jgi:NAD(P)H-hydrate epimerase
LVLAGSGGNGGGGLAAARTLQNWGAQVHVFISKPDERMRPVPAHQLKILRQIGTPISLANDINILPPSDLILDAVIGYSLQGPPKGASAQLIEMANASSANGAPILSLDVPSGMDSTTGEVKAPFISAAATMTLALPKIGLMTDSAKPFVGDLFLADISVPPGLYAALGLVVPSIFAEKEIIRIY